MDEAAFKENLARKPDGSDRSQAKAIYAGECDIALGNTYYVGLMLTNEKEPEEKEWATSIKVIFPTSAPTAAPMSTFPAWRWPNTRRTATTPSS